MPALFLYIFRSIPTWNGSFAEAFFTNKIGLPSKNICEKPKTTKILIFLHKFFMLKFYCIPHMQLFMYVLCMCVCMQGCGCRWKWYPVLTTAIPLPAPWMALQRCWRLLAKSHISCTKGGITSSWWVTGCLPCSINREWSCGFKKRKASNGWLCFSHASQKVCLCLSVCVMRESICSTQWNVMFPTTFFLHWCNFCVVSFFLSFSVRSSYWLVLAVSMKCPTSSNCCWILTCLSPWFTLEWKRCTPSFFLSNSPGFVAKMAVLFISDGAAKGGSHGLLEKVPLPRQREDADGGAQVWHVPRACPGKGRASHQGTGEAQAEKHR